MNLQISDSNVNQFIFDCDAQHCFFFSLGAIQNTGYVRQGKVNARMLGSRSEFSPLPVECQSMHDLLVVLRLPLLPIR